MKATLAAVTALMIVASPIAAQTNTPASPVEAQKNAPQLSFVDQQKNSEVLGTDFIGTAVRTKDGQQIGEISNLVFDQQGRIELAVIGIGGFLGIGEKYVAVPFDDVKSEVDNNKHVLVVDATKDQLMAAPTFKTLNADSFMKDWRAKAHQAWAEMKSGATKAYDEAKQQVEQAK
jgi:sporulation protein YlmC with PRC-barrel domain